jgi:hypothetical protein
MPVVNGKKYPYTEEGIKAAKRANDDLYGPDAVMTGIVGMPKYTNDPRAWQGQKLKKGGCVKKSR